MLLMRQRGKPLPVQISHDRFYHHSSKLHFLRPTKLFCRRKLPWKNTCASSFKFFSVVELGRGEIEGRVKTGAVGMSFQEQKLEGRLAEFIKA